MLRSLASKFHNVGVGLESTHVYRLTRHDPIADVVPAIDVRYEQLDEAGLDQLATLGPLDRDECEARLARGDGCYAAFAEDGLAHYSWVQRAGIHPIDAAGLDVEIAPHELWIFNCRTSEAHRGQSLYPAMLQHLVLDHFDLGFETAWIYTSKDNVASQHGIERVGFVQVDTLRALRIGRYFRPLDDRKAS